MEFKEGDLVMLKSGGVTMTVEEIDEDGDVGCVWFDAGTPKRGYFPRVTLKAVQEPKASVEAI